MRKAVDCSNAQKASGASPVFLWVMGSRLLPGWSRRQNQTPSVFMATLPKKGPAGRGNPGSHPGGDASPISLERIKITNTFTARDTVESLPNAGCYLKKGKDCFYEGVQPDLEVLMYLVYTSLPSI